VRLERGFVNSKQVAAVLFLLAISVITVNPAFLRAALPTQASQTWSAGPSLSEVRGEATATVMFDGRVLIAGGAAADGTPSAMVDVLNVDGTIAAASKMNIARKGHAAVWLYDGYVLVTGGTTAGGGVTNTAEIYDPLNDRWTLLPNTMVDPRSGHTATNLYDGRILMAGGSNGSSAVASVETFSIVSEQFSFAGTMSAPRKSHAAVALADGRVAIIGGTDVDGVDQASSYTFDADSNQLIAGPSLNVPRSAMSATRLLNGSVLVAGGRNGDQELASAELLDFTAGTASIIGPMNAPRAEHSALLLTDNNEVLIVGGKTSGKATDTVEIFRPWTNQFRSAASMETARTAISAINLTYPGRAIVLGGTEVATTELYAFSTVKTDYADYYPGDTAIISGTGWNPQEQVTLRISSPRYPSTVLNAKADFTGKIVNSEFIVPMDAEGASFTVTAVGADSQAQAAFTDANQNTTTAVQSSLNPSAQGQGVTFTASTVVAGTSTVVTCGTIQFRDGATNLGAPVTLSAGSPTAAYLTSALTAGSHSITAAYVAGNGNCKFNNSNSTALSQTVKQASTTTVASSLNPSNYGDTVTFTVTVTGAGATPTGSVTLLRGGVTMATLALAGGRASYSISALTAGSFDITAQYGGDSTYASSSSSIVAQGINKATATVGLAGLNTIFDGTPKAASATTSPNGLALTVTYDGSLTVPSAHGNYAVVASVVDPNYSGTASGTLVIGRANASIDLRNLNASYDGSPKAVLVATTPVGVATTVTYNGSASAPTNAGTYAVVVTVSDPNYSGSANGSLIISKATATISLGNLSQSFDGTPKSASVVTTPNGLSNTVTYNGSVAAPTSAGTYAVVATIADPNYDGVTNGSLAISKADQTINFAGVPSSAKFNSTFTASVSATSGLPVSVLASGSCSISGSEVTMTSGSGTCLLTADQAGDADHNSAPQALQAVAAQKISQSSLTMLGMPGTAQPYGSSFDVSTSGGDGTGAVTFESSGSCSVAANTVTINSGTGFCYVTATKAGSEDYDPTISATGVTNVKAATQSLTFTGAPSTAKYQSTFNVSAVSNPAGSVVITAAGGCTVNGTLVTMTSGTTACNLSAYLPGDSNYAAAHATQSTAAEKADQSLTFPALQATQVSGTTFNVSAGATSGLPVSFASAGSCSLSGSQVTLTGAGSCSITASQAGDANFAAANPVTQSITVVSSIPVINWSNPTSVVYGASLSGAQLNASATANGSALPGNFAYTPVAGTILGAGLHDLSVLFTPFDSNYSAISKTVQINVLPATASVIGPSLARPYGDVNSIFTPQYSGFVNGESAAVLNAGATCSSSATAISPIGTYPITCSGATASNYVFAPVNGSLTVNKALLSVTPGNASKPQGSANPSFTGVVSGIKNNDPITAAYSTTATQTSPVGSYSITSTASDNASGALANYTVTLNTATLTITSTSTKPDLIETVSVLASNATAGGTIQISDTATNVGGTTAAASFTRFYLSNNGMNKLGSLDLRAVPSLATSASSGPVTSTVTLPSNIAGNYYIVACADDGGSIPESSETNNCSASTAFSIGGADLFVSSVTAPTTSAAGATISISDTTTNQGAAAAASFTRFYLSSNRTNKLSSLAVRSVPALASTVSSGPISTTLTLPANLAGTYYVLACADDAASVLESNETNNCTASAAMTITGADLTVSSVTAPSTATPGANLSVTDTTMNLGAASANASFTRFYLSNNGTNKLLSLGTRAVPILASVTGSGPLATAVALPLNLNGKYYVLACADDGGSVVESNESNNCSASGAIRVQ
jgi:MBG domain/Bacterial Ig-like domain (group 3)/MBG domain (YGX type)/CARDB/Kelch motif